MWQWLVQHPSKYETRKRGEVPVVMDEIRPSALSTPQVLFSDPNIATVTSPIGSSPTGTPPSGAGKAFSGSGSGSIVTFSMLNWDKDLREELQQQVNNIGSASKTSSGTVNNVDRYFIDDFEMLVAVEPGSEGFYVVM